MHDYTFQKLVLLALRMLLQRLTLGREYDVGLKEWEYQVLNYLSEQQDNMVHK